MKCFKYFTLRVLREVAMFEFGTIKNKLTREHGEACFVRGALWAKAEIEKELLKEQNVNALTKDLKLN